MRLLAATLTLLVLLAGCSGSDEEADPDVAPTTASPSTDDGGLPAIQDVAAAGGVTLDVDDADWIQVVDGQAWTTVPGAVIRLDAEGEVTARVPADPGSCLAMDVEFGSLWVGICDEREPRVLRISTTTGKLESTIALPRGRQFIPEGSIGAGEGGVWVVAITGAGDKRLLRIDPDRDRVADDLEAPLTVAGARAGLGGVWLTDPSNAAVVRIDPQSGLPIAEIPAGVGARFFAVGEGAVWVQNNTDGTVTRIDPATDEALATIPVDESIINGGDLAVGGGYVWARVSGSLVAQIDPATDTVVARYGAAEGSGSVAADDDAVWITAHDVDAIYRIPIR
jgi:virginiamycin B lyase